MPASPTSTKSGASRQGVRIWGFANGEPLNRKFTLEDNGKPIAVELFRKTSKGLTITGYTLDPAIRELQNVDKVFDWALVWGERRKAAQEKVTVSAGNGFDSDGCQYSIDQIEHIVREGAPAGSNRSDVFHAIVGHYVGCGWQVDRIFEHFQQYPQGVGERYIAEDRLRQEIERSASKYAKTELPLFDNWKAKAPPEPAKPEPEPEEQPEDVENDDLGEDEAGDDDDQELQDDPRLPKLCRPNDRNDQSLKRWLIKNLLPEVGHGILAGPWGFGKTFALFDLAVSPMTMQPFLHHAVKRQGAVLLIAAEGADEVRLRLDAVIREKCGGMKQVPFYWYDEAAPRLQKGSTELLIAMARQAEADAKEKFGLPISLIMIDTLAACSGYTKRGDDFDPAVVQALMNVLKAVARTIGCFVLGVGHSPKNVEAGVSGSYAKEWSADVVWLSLGDRALNGTVTNTRLSIRKHRGGLQGAEYPYAQRVVEMGKDEDGDPITTIVMDWLPAGAAVQQAPPTPDDPWLAGCRRDDQQAKMYRFKQVLLAALAEHGIEQPIPTVSPSEPNLDELRGRTSPPLYRERSSSG